MGGGAPPAAVLLCLLIRAVLPGFAQEVSTNQNADFGSEVPAATTVSSIVTSTVPQDSGSIVSDATPGGKDNETITLTAPPPSGGPSTIPESFTGTSAMTEGPQGTNNGTGGTAPSPGDTDPETRGGTGPSLTQPPPTAHTPTIPVTEEVTTGAPGILTESPLLPSTAPAQTQNNTETPPGSTQPAATNTALHADRTSAANPPITTAQPTSPPMQSAATPPSSRPEEEEERDPSQLEVGDHKETPGFHAGGGSNPLFVMIVSVFTIMVVMVVVGVGFHRYKKRNRRTDFRRLQDLPMDDMMEDTPLALYSY